MAVLDIPAKAEYWDIFCDSVADSEFVRLFLCCYCCRCNRPSGLLRRGGLSQGDTRPQERLQRGHQAPLLSSQCRHGGGQGEVGV